MWQEPDLPIEPPPTKRLVLPLMSLLPRSCQEFINAAWFIVSSSEPLRYERLALTYHGFYLGDWFTPDSGFRVRQVEPHKSGRLSISKRVTDIFRSEVDLLRLLASKDMRDKRNHTALPTNIIWGQRIHITPFYFEGYGSIMTPNAVLNLTKQLTEAVAFLHEQRIAHLDISPRNFLLASNSELEKPRLLLTDFEFAVAFSSEADPVVDLWHRALAPPEGKKAINAFAFDMWCVGCSFYSYFMDYSIREDYPKLIWPAKWINLYQQMAEEQPELRPTASDADLIMQEIDDNQTLEYSGGSTYRFDIDLSRPRRLRPTLRSDTPLPVPREFRAETIDW